ncbi:MAG: hypothetical protein RIS47_637 [Bacteroidota bacterium]
MIRIVKNSLGLLCIVAVCLIVACQPKVKYPDIQLISINDTLHIIQLKTDSTTNRWTLPYPVYQFQLGDIDQDGSTDILVGVVKRTHFDTLVRKRLFIFKNFEGYIRPLWMGSGLGQPISDFRFLQTSQGARIRSIERERNGKFLLAEYKWAQFGLDFTKYIVRNTDSIKALQIFMKE